MKHEIATNRGLRWRDPTQFPSDPIGAPTPLLVSIEQMVAAMSDIWVEMETWTPEQRRTHLPTLVSPIRLLETRLMVLRQRVMREIAGSYDLVKPSRAGVVPDESDDGED